MRLIAGLLLLAAAASSQEEKRVVIALFDGAAHRLNFDFDDPVHQVLEMPLNHLGMVVRRHDIRQGPPPDAWLADARAVLTLFTGVGGAPDWLWPYLRSKPEGLRIVHVGDVGPLLRPEGGPHDPAPLTRWLEAFGLAYDDRYREGPVGVEVAYRSKELCALEADPRGLALHRGPRNLSTSNRAWVTTRNLLAAGEERTPVVTGPWGGLALDPWVVSMGDDNEERRWHLDPFEFFRAALGLEGVPSPDPSLLHGRRMLVLHIDGDGFESASTVRPGQSNARVVLDELLLPHPLPWTVSVIIRSVTTDYNVAEPTPEMLLAREIFALPHIEPASHGVLHPLRWDAPLNDRTPPRTAVWYPALRNYTYNATNEVTESIRFVNERLLPEGRTCRMMLWTGSTNAPREAVAACAELGCGNLNGGVFRWDPWFDSMAFVSPWARMLGDAVQVYAGAANENDFEGFFDTCPGAFGHVDTTIERTGTPRILKPANIYFHFYSAERPARLAALKRLVQRWAYEEETIPVHASVYANAVTSAIAGCRVERTPVGWNLRGFGGCRTARIDGEAREIDWVRSRGLLGGRRIGSSLYLDLAGPAADVVFGDGRSPHVEHSDHPLTAGHLLPGGLMLVSEGLRERRLVLAGLRPGQPAVISGTPSRADPTGRLVLRLPPGRQVVALDERATPARSD